MKNIFVILFCTFCMSVFGMEERFRDFETYGIHLTIVNSTDKNINIKGRNNSLGIFSSLQKSDSFAIPTGEKHTLEVVFKKVIQKGMSSDTIEISQDDDNFVLLDIFKIPSLSVERNSNKGLVYKLYSAKKGGGAEYYLVVAKDELSLSLCKPRNSSAQSYSEIDSSDSDREL